MFKATLSKMAAVAAVSFALSMQPLMAAEEQTWQVNLKDADISAFISQVADITGESFIIDPRVKGKVNVVSAEDMDEEAVYELFLSVLKVHGYTAIPAGEVTLVVQQNRVKQEGRDLNEKVKTSSQEMLTKVIAITNTPALDLVPILRPLVAKYGHLAGVKSANSLIISDHASNIHRIEQIIQRLDKSGSEELEVIQLKEAWVGNVVTMLQNLDPTKVSQGKSGGAGAGRVRVVADERSNRLIIKGEKTARERIRQLIEQLDQPSYFSGTAQVMRLQYADAKKLSELLKNVMSESSSGGKDTKKQVKGKASIFADEDLNALVVRAEPSLLKEVEELVAQLDVRRAQVLIESAIIEVKGNITDALGVQWGLGDVNNPVGGTNFTAPGQSSLNNIIGAVSGTATTAPALSNGLTLAGFESNGKGGANFGAVIQMLQSQTNTNVLSTPSIMTLDNQEAEIIVGQNVPFVTGSTTSSSNSNPFNTIKREDIGVTLKVTPHIHDGDVLRLEVEASEESVASQAGASDLVTNKRSLKTMILAKDGETIVLGGLIKDSVELIESKVPLLGDLPLLGWLFRSSQEKVIKENLMVFLRPTIVLDESKSRALTRQKYDGLWEFEVSNQLGVDAIDKRVEGLFKGELR